MERKWHDYFNSDHSPKRCTKCGGPHINTKTTATDGGYASEVEYICHSCGECLGYWAYGSFDPGYEMDFKKANMHEKTITLFDCGPLEARMTQENCDKTRRMRKPVLKFNNDQEGLPTHKYENCSGCQGVTGKGEAVYVTASSPRPERVAVITIDGVFGYV